MKLMVMDIHSPATCLMILQHRAHLPVLPIHLSSSHPHPVKIIVYGVSFYSTHCRVIRVFDSYIPKRLIRIIVKVVSANLFQSHQKWISKVFNSKQNHRGLRNNLHVVGVKTCKINLVTHEPASPYASSSLPAMAATSSTASRAVGRSIVK